MTLWRQRRSKHANYLPQWYISGDSERSSITDWGHTLQRITTKHFYTKYDMGFTYYAPVYAYEWVFEKLLHLNDLRLFSGNQVYISCKHGQSPIKRYRREDYTSGFMNVYGFWQIWIWLSPSSEWNVQAVLLGRICQIQDQFGYHSNDLLMLRESELNMDFEFHVLPV